MLSGLAAFCSAWCVGLGYTRGVADAMAGFGFDTDDDWCEEPWMDEDEADCAFEEPPTMDLPVVEESEATEQHVVMMTPKKARITVSSPDHVGSPLLPTRSQAGSSSAASSSTSPATSSSPSSSVVTRKRLSFKQAPPDWAKIVSDRLTSIDGHYIPLHPLLKRYMKQSAKTRRVVSKRVCQMKYRVLTSLKEHREVTISNKIIRWPEGTDFDVASKELDQAFAEFIAVDNSRDSLDRGYALSVLAAGLKQNEMVSAEPLKNVRVGGTPSILLTYNGDFGLVDVDSFHVDGRVSALSTGDNPIFNMDVDDVAKLLRSHPDAKRLRDTLQTIAVNMTNRMKTPWWAFSVELCPKTFQKEKVLRLHAHLWISTRGQSVLLEDFALGKQGEFLPFVNWAAQSFCGTAGGRGVASMMSGAFYCSVEKIGQVFAEFNTSPFLDYPVRDTWVTSLYASHKISAAVARRCYVQCVVRCQQNLVQLAFAESERRAMQEEDEVIANEVALRADQKPWRHFPLVSEWLAQYQTFRPRYRFLVLDGPSSTGKTRYALGLSAPGRSFYVDCSLGSALMKGFNKLKYDSIIYDELSPACAIVMKKPLQASNEVVTFAASPTMQCAFQLHLHKVRMIVCTNTWQATLSKLAEHDREWLNANAFYLRVDGPMWEDDAAAA